MQFITKWKWVKKFKNACCALLACLKVINGKNNIVLATQKALNAHGAVAAMAYQDCEPGPEKWTHITTLMTTLAPKVIIIIINKSCMHSGKFWAIIKDHLYMKRHQHFKCIFPMISKYFFEAPLCRIQVGGLCIQQPFIYRISAKMTTQTLVLITKYTYALLPSTQILWWSLKSCKNLKILVNYFCS